MPIGRSGATVAESPVWRRLGLAALVLTFAAVALAFALPWLPEGTPGGSELERYLPDRDSASRLGVVRGASGRTEGWETVTEARIPAFQAFGDLRNGFQNAISAFYARRAEDSVPVRELPDRLEDVQIVQSRTAPFVGFSGIAIIALGLVWDVLTFGPWVNRESAGLPRVSRLFIYIGYGLFGVTLINWSLTAHELSEIEFFTGGAALEGFSLFGTPLLYVVFGVVLAAVARERPTSGEDAAAAR